MFPTTRMKATRSRTITLEDAIEQSARRNSQQILQNGRMSAAKRLSEAMAATNGGSSAGGGIKDRKRKRDLIEKVHELTEDMCTTREELYDDIMVALSDEQESLLSLPPTNIEYLLGVQKLTLQRENDLLLVQLQYNTDLDTARLVHTTALHQAEEEYAASKRAVVERLKEACEEKRRALIEEKDNLESLFDPTKTHSTRGARRPATALTSPSKAAAAMDIDDGIVAGAGGAEEEVVPSELEPPNAISVSSALSALLASQPSAGQLPSDGLTAAFPLLAKSISVAANARPTRGRKAKINGWAEGSKNLAGAKSEEVDGDLGEIRRRKPRTTRAMGLMDT
ncbi:hypothetical protein BT69DRAFT_1320526 [Atractiella rhizophila]|nr:hypothetical protein BT69DRAFT_1320526 [Atractiella rhizophila]